MDGLSWAARACLPSYINDFVIKPMIKARISRRFLIARDLIILGKFGRWLTEYISDLENGADPKPWFSLMEKTVSQIEALRNKECAEDTIILVCSSFFSDLDKLLDQK